MSCSPRSLADLDRARPSSPSATRELKITNHQLPNTRHPACSGSLNEPFDISQRSCPIASMAQYRTNDSPLRTTQRAPRSCRSCASRKVKCDKAVPCSTCIKRGDADTCVREVVIVRGKLVTFVMDWIPFNEITPNLHTP